MSDNYHPVHLIAKPQVFEIPTYSKKVLEKVPKGMEGHTRGHMSHRRNGTAKRSREIVDSRRQLGNDENHRPASPRISPPPLSTHYTSTPVSIKANSPPPQPEVQIKEPEEPHKEPEPEPQAQLPVKQEPVVEPEPKVEPQPEPEPENEIVPKEISDKILNDVVKQYAGKVTSFNE